MQTHPLTPIATFHCDQKYRYDQPRQGVLQKHNETGVIRLVKNTDYKLALSALAGFERIWLIFGFHLNSNWKALIVPPVHTNSKKIGVFASRAPYRPNPIGLSCVRLLEVDEPKGEILIAEYDLLDGSPVYDIKPYLPYCDSFPGVRAGFTGQEEIIFRVNYSGRVKSQLGWIREQGGPDFRGFIERQLEFNPEDGRRKRIRRGSAPASRTLAYRTWRIEFLLNRDERSVLVENILSGYNAAELAAPDDRYQDKELHRLGCRLGIFSYG